MNIYAEHGTVVKAINDEINRMGGCDQVKDYLILGGFYTVDYTEVHTWHTKVHLVEFPGKVFNSVCFEEV